MKFLFTLLPLIAMQYTSAAQYDNNNKKDSLKILNAKYAYRNIEIGENEHSTISLPFDTIEFRDVRYDTTFVAMNFPIIHFSNTYNTKIDLLDGFANNLDRYFNNYYSTVNKNHNELICYVKKFSITQQYELLEHFNSGNLSDNLGNEINIEIECYYRQGDTLFPAMRFDTSYFHHFPGRTINVSSTIKDLLQPFMRKIELIDLNRVIQRKHYNEDEISGKYNARFNIPILTTDIYKKGIYKNFNELRNNAPSVDSFTISTDKFKVIAGGAPGIDEESLLLRSIQKRSTLIYLHDKNNQLISPSEIYGYCDGTTLWIQHGAFFYPLVRTGNAFEFMYTYHYSDSHNSTYTVYILTPLNMETGLSN